MKKRSLYGAVLNWTVLLAVLFLAPVGPVRAGPETAKRGSGIIRTIDTMREVVAVEISGGDESHTVAGAVGGSAVITKNQKQATLRDLSAGDRVSMDWTFTRRGHSITRITASDPDARLVSGLGENAGVLNTVIGTPVKHIVKKGETLLDIARRHGLGFNEIQDLYPSIDPWIPPEGMELIIPSQWVLPSHPLDGIVINTAELRLFMTDKTCGIRTFPVGAGDEERPSPLGSFRIGARIKDPAWRVPPSLRKKYGQRVIPPGPDNPLGQYWLGLGGTRYGIHGTDFPWSVGRTVTRGCIRLYPEDISVLFDLTAPGTPVHIVYEPVKIGRLDGRIYAEVHRDIYGLVHDLESLGFMSLRAKGLEGLVDLEVFRRALIRRDGMPADITPGRKAADGPGKAASERSQR
jgi:L,D-transpeptidase ErfK/SrfK